MTEYGMADAVEDYIHVENVRAEVKNIDDAIAIIDDATAVCDPLLIPALTRVRMRLLSLRDPWKQAETEALARVRQMSWYPDYTR